MFRRIAALILAAALALALSSCAAEPATIYAGIDELPSRRTADSLLLDVTLSLCPAADPNVPISLDAPLDTSTPLGADSASAVYSLALSTEHSSDGHCAFTLSFSPPTT